MRRLTTLIALACGLIVVFAMPAASHTGLDASKPKGGATVRAPVDTLTLRFTQPITLAGSGIEVLDASGESVAVDTDVDAARVTVTPEMPLPPGRYGVRWRVRSGDAHPIDGSYTFAVAKPVDAFETAPPQADTTPSTPPGESGSEPAPTGAAESDTGPSPVDGLEAALAVDPTRSIRAIDQLLRAIFYAVVLAAVGVLAFLITSWEGTRREAWHLTRISAGLAAVAAIVTVAQVVVRSARTAGAWAGAGDELAVTLSGSYQLGVSVRVIGAVLIVVGSGAVRRTLWTDVQPIAGGAVDLAFDRPHVGAHAWTPIGRLRDGGTATAGALLLIGSFAFIGHATTAEPRAVATFAVLAHTAAAALWGGGLLGLVVTLQLRRRSRRPLHAGRVVAQFSVLATIGVALAAAAGVALAAVRLERIDELWATAYGLVLLAKVAVVAVVGGLGAYNHFRLVPALRRSSGPRVTTHLRRIGLVELALLTVVAGLTSALVGLAG